MADERKTGVSFSFSKKKPSHKAYSAEKNALNTVKEKEEERDYIHAAEGKELKRLVQLLHMLSKTQCSKHVEFRFDSLLLPLSMDKCGKCAVCQNLNLNFVLRIGELQSIIRLVLHLVV